MSQFLFKPLGVLLIFTAGFTGCEDKLTEQNSELAAKSLTAAEKSKKGLKLYQANCIACHNMDPKVDGALGPAVYGSNVELIAERVLRGGYPAGYKPKRSTRMMVPMPQLESELDNLYHYLNGIE